MPGGVQTKKAKKIAQAIIGKPESEIGADRPFREDRHTTPRSRNIDPSTIRPDDSEVGRSF